MHKKIITGLALFSVLAVSAQAATIRYKTSGDWFDTTNSTANANGWQTTGALPGSLDTVQANWGGDTGNTVILSAAAPTVNKFEIGVNESGTFHIQNGGVLTTLSDSRVGHSGSGALRTGTLNIDAGGTVTVGSWMGIGHGAYGYATVSGVLNANSHLWMGATSDADSVGSLIIEDGGVVNVGGQLGLGTINATDASGGSATITVNSGGLLNLDRWAATGSIQSNSVLNINNGGTVVVGGNRISQANAYFAAGKIASDLGEIQAIFDSDLNQTTIVAIPEPATLGLVAAFGGAVLFIRRLFMI